MNDARDKLLLHYNLCETLSPNPEMMVILIFKTYLVLHSHLFWVKKPFSIKSIDTFIPIHMPANGHKYGRPLNISQDIVT